MADETSQQKVFAKVRRFFKFTRAAYASLATALTLTLLALVIAASYHADAQRVAWSDYLDLPQMLGLVFFGIAVCTATYWTVRLWNEDLPASDKSLESAWQSGIDALEQRGIELSSVPLFLVLGCEQLSAQQRLIAESGLSLIAEPTPNFDSAPVRWFIGSDRVYLFCHGASTMTETQRRLALYGSSALKAKFSNLVSVASSRLSDSVGIREANIHTKSTTWSSQFSSAQTHYSKTASSLKGVGRIHHSTPESDQWIAVCTEQVAPDYGVSGDPQAIQSAESSLQRAESLMYMLSAPEADNARGIPARDHLEQTLGVLTSTELLQMEEMRSDLCRRLRSARKPVAAINGILVCVDAQQMECCGELVHPFGNALQRDLQSMQRCLGVQAPVSVLVENMYRVAGYSEFVRRSGLEVPEQEAIGAVFQIRRPPSPAAVRYLCQQAMRSLGLRIYGRMQPNGGVLQPGNLRLFRLLTTCRSRLLSNLCSFMTEATQWSIHEPTDEPIALSGLHFGSAGTNALEKGYIGRVFQQMFAQHELLNWTQLERKRQMRVRRWLFAMKVVVFALAIALCVRIALIYS